MPINYYTLNGDTLNSGYEVGTASGYAVSIENIVSHYFKASGNIVSIENNVRTIASGNLVSIENTVI